ncbi:MAG: SCO family protein [Betaproteobacteria bacterium]
MKNQKLWITSIITLVIALVWLAFFWQPSTPSTTAQSPAQISATPAGGDFTLSSPAGQVSLANYRGKVVLIYFGYTFCPDVCPTSLANLAQALATLTPSELDKVQGLFISVDPERDTMDVLKVYAPYFHPRILGLSGSPAQVAEVAKLYGARYMKQKPNADGLYSVDHSSFTYVIAPDGKLTANLIHGSQPQQIVDMIRKLLNK